jgi:hypothetical protein
LPNLTTMPDFRIKNWEPQDGTPARELAVNRLRDAACHTLT